MQPELSDRNLGFSPEMPHESAAEEHFEKVEEVEEVGEVGEVEVEAEECGVQAETRRLPTKELLVRAILTVTFLIFLSGMALLLIQHHASQEPATSNVASTPPSLPSSVPLSIFSQQPPQNVPRLDALLRQANAFAFHKLGSQRRVYLTLGLAALVVVGILAATFVLGLFANQQLSEVRLVFPDPESPTVHPLPAPLLPEPSLGDPMWTSFWEMSSPVIGLWVAGGLLALFSIVALFVDTKIKYSHEWGHWRWSSLVFTAGLVLSSTCLGIGSAFGGSFATLMMASIGEFVPLIWLAPMLVLWLAFGLHRYWAPDVDLTTLKWTRYDLLVLGITSLTMGALGAIGGALGAFGAFIAVTCALVLVFVVRGLSLIVRESNRKASAIVFMGTLLLLCCIPLAYFEPLHGVGTFGLSLLGGSVLVAVRQLKFQASVYFGQTEIIELNEGNAESVEFVDESADE